MKKLAIIGRGTAGCIAAAHFLKYTDWDIDFYYDPTIKPQAVGEATWPGLAADLYKTIEFNVFDLESIDGTFKTGVSKEGWGTTGNKFFHHLFPGSVAYHFNAVKLQEFILNRLKDNLKVKFYKENITDYNKIDADFIFDCSGKPTNFDNHEILEHIPVNAVHVTMCYWDKCEFQYSLANATKYGWHFGIPLQNRCAIGYIYNNNINNIDDIKQDSLSIIEGLNLTPSDHTNSINFKSYKRKQNFTERVAYSGNSSFFIEPLEATSFWIGDKIQRFAFDYWHKNVALEDINLQYQTLLKEAEDMIMLHYFAGSKHKTPFWGYAQQKGKECMYEALNNYKFKKIISQSYEQTSLSMVGDLNIGPASYSGWGPNSYHQNLEGLGLKDTFKQLLKV